MTQLDAIQHGINTLSKTDSKEILTHIVREYPQIREQILNVFLEAKILRYKNKENNNESRPTGRN